MAKERKFRNSTQKDTVVNIYNVTFAYLFGRYDMLLSSSARSNHNHIEDEKEEEEDYDDVFFFKFVSSFSSVSSFHLIIGLENR